MGSVATWAITTLRSSILPARNGEARQFEGRNQRGKAGRKRGDAETRRRGDAETRRPQPDGAAETDEKKRSFLNREKPSFVERGEALDGSGNREFGLECFSPGFFLTAVRL